MAIHVNIHDEAMLADKYRVAAAPTIVFVNAQGEEIGRIEGYRAPQPFLEAAADIVTKR